MDFAAYPTVVTEEVFAYAHSKNIKVHSNPLMFLCPLLFLCRSVCGNKPANQLNSIIIIIVFFFFVTTTTISLSL